MEYYLKKNNFISYIIITIVFLFKYNLSYIVLPFKINSSKKASNITELVYNLVDDQLIVTLPMGDPKANIDFYSSMNLYLYYLEEDSCLPNYYPSYDISKSKSFIFKRNLTSCMVKLERCTLGEERLYLYQDINLQNTTEIFPFKFYLGYRRNNINKNNKQICGN